MGAPKKVWGKGKSTQKIVEDFTVGKDRELDCHLAKYDVQGSIAHARMLGKTGIIDNSEAVLLENELNIILDKIDEGGFEIPEGFEDIHSYVEYLLTENLGETGKKIHTGRSRNDQVLVDLHLYIKSEIEDIKTGISQLSEQFMLLSRQHKEVLIPGYTHMQVAMPSSFGLWFGAYAETLIDDIYVFNAAYKVADQNPLGSAAGYGSSFPLDRKMTTRDLGFHTMKYNSIAAQLSRGRLEKVVAFALSSLAGTLSKFAMDIVMYMNENFGFISFPDDVTTGSSIMPHKKNPDVFELVRAKCNKIQTLPTEISLLTGNLPSGYHRDFQLLKENLFEGIKEIKSVLEIVRFMLQKINVNKDVMATEKYNMLFTVESVSKLVKEGVSFREAYLQVVDQIEKNEYIPEEKLEHTHEGSIGNLCLDEIKEKLESAMAG
jgi:argininosuccinate lyase